MKKEAREINGKIFNNSIKLDHTFIYHAKFIRFICSLYSNLFVVGVII